MPDESPIRIAFLGDIFASRGRMVVRQQLPALRESLGLDVVVANAENARSGSGLTPALFEKVRSYGVDAVTLGDHCFRDGSITPLLESPETPIARPANLATRAPGSRWTAVPIPGRDRTLYVITVLGRVFFPLPANDPFQAVDDVLAGLPEPDPLVLVEAHMEATSEKAALAHHLDGRVAAVLGTHTHVPTADARILPGGTAFQTDVGMCGARHSVIGRDVDSVLRHMTANVHVRFGLGEGDERMCGCVVDVDHRSSRAVAVHPFQRAADPGSPPFNGGLA